MTKLEQAIKTLQTLPPADQEFYADWVLAAQHTNDNYVLSDKETAEVGRRLAANEETVSAEKVFAKFDL